MKRPFRSKNRSLVTPFFARWIWRRCIKCRDEFKREFGWRYLIHYEFDVHGPGTCIYGYICESCGPDETTALAIRNADMAAREETE